jgi:pectinesterase
MKVFMTRKVFHLSLILSLLSFSGLFAAGDSNSPWPPNEKLSGLAKLFEPEKVRQIVVDQNGPADFNTIQEAIDAIPNNNKERVVVLIKPGFYRKRVLIPKDKPFVTLRGIDLYKTIISYDLHHDMMQPDGSGIYRSECATLRVRSDDFIIENLTVENTYGPHPQALAAKFDCNSVIAVNCRLLGGQDTLMANSGRQYYLNCYIEGGTDFIYGYAQAIFENCRIHSNESKYITAHAALEPNLPGGYVFYNCRVTTDESVVTYLGRPWRPYAKVVFYNCWLDKGIQSVGWDNWRDPAREKTAFFAEYKSHGPGANPSARVKWSRQLTDEQAQAFVPENFMKLDGKTVDDWLRKILDFRKSSGFGDSPE